MLIQLWQLKTVLLQYSISSFHSFPHPEFRFLFEALGYLPCRSADFSAFPFVLHLVLFLLHFFPALDNRISNKCSNQVSEIACFNFLSPLSDHIKMVAVILGAISFMILKKWYHQSLLNTAAALMSKGIQLWWLRSKQKKNWRNVCTCLCTHVSLQSILNFGKSMLYQLPCTDWVTDKAYIYFNIHIPTSFPGSMSTNNHNLFTPMKVCLQ